MKKVLAFLLAAVMVFALCACGGSSAPAATPAPAQDAAPAPVEVKEESIAVEDPFAEAPTVNEEKKEVIEYGEQDKPIQLGQPAELLGD